jgi:large subunit ribosomal protein L53
MLTSHFTAFRATFNPFTRQGKVARLLLSYLPPDARQQMKIQTTVLPKVVPAGVTQGEVAVTFSE